MLEVKNVANGAVASLSVPKVVNAKPELLQRLHSLALRCLKSFGRMLVEPRLCTCFLGACATVLSYVIYLERTGAVPPLTSNAYSTNSIKDFLAMLWTDATYPTWVRIASVGSQLGLYLSIVSLSGNIGYKAGRARARKDTELQLEKANALLQQQLRENAKIQAEIQAQIDRLKLEYSQLAQGHHHPD